MKTVVVIPNPDKEGYLLDDKNPLLPSCGEKLIFSGRSGSGKGVAAKNIIGRMDPPADRIVVFHGDPTGTKEWEDCGAELKGIDELVDTNWVRGQKTVCVIDEVPIDSLPKAQRTAVERLLNYFCSHYGVICMLLCQSFYSIPPACRRAADRWVLFPSIDEQVNRDIAAKTGHDMKQLKKLCTSKYDCIQFNFSGRGPPLLFNLFEEIIDTEADD